MPFKSEVQNYVINYYEQHLPNDKWLDDNYDFIENIDLRERIKIEFKNARIVYKLFEGLQAKGQLLLAEVRLQILMFASIYEAIIHYLLFDVYYDATQVKELQQHTIPKRVSIPSNKKLTLKNALSHDGKDIIPFYYDKCKREITSIRFDEKCRVAMELGLIDMELMGELTKIYEIRNGLHIHAEMKKEIEYEIEQSRLAYWRMEKFVKGVKEYMSRTGTY